MSTHSVVGCCYQVLDWDEMLPAVAQGAIGIQVLCRAFIPNSVYHGMQVQSSPCVAGKGV